MNAVKTFQNHVQEVWAACTWGNTNESADDWLQAFLRDDKDKKQRIFSIIFREVPDTFVLRQLYTAEELKKYLESMDKPLSRAHLERRRKVLRFLYCGIKEPIPGLDWIK
ncbi:hypothetical protein MASR2M78_15730 [Treponema sp.]